VCVNVIFSDYCSAFLILPGLNLLRPGPSPSVLLSSAVCICTVCLCVCGPDDPLPVVIVPSPGPETYNAPVTYTCSYNSSSLGNTFLFMNGVPVSRVGGILDGGVVRHSSFYQCYVLMSAQPEVVYYGQRTVVPQRE